MVRAFGIAYSKPPEKDDYAGVYYTRKDLEEQADAIGGTKVMMEHGFGQSLEHLPEGMKDAPDVSIGEVVRGGLDQDGRLVVELELNRDTLTGCRAIRHAREGKLSLSLGQKLRIDPKTMKVVGKKIHEVSTVIEPDMEGTDIIWVEPDSEDFRQLQDSLDSYSSKKKQDKFGIVQDLKVDRPQNVKEVPERSTHLWKQEEQQPSSSMSTIPETTTTTSTPAAAALAAVATEVPPTTTTAIKPDDILLQVPASEVKEMMEQIKKISQENALLHSKFDEWREVGLDPDVEVKRKAERVERKRKEMESGLADIKDWIVQMYNNKKIRPELLKDLEQLPKQDVDKAYPMYELLATASAYTKTSLSEQNKLVTAAQAEASRLQKENEMIRTLRGEIQGRQNYAQMVGQGTVPSPAAAAAAVAAVPPPQQQQQPQNMFTAPFRKSVDVESLGRDVWKPQDLPAQMSDKVRGIRALQSADSRKMLDIVMSTPRVNNTRFQIPGLVGKNYPIPSEENGVRREVDPETGMAHYILPNQSTEINTRGQSRQALPAPNMFMF